MPPRGRRLRRGEIDLLREWIRSGAPWDQHWSMVPPRDHPPPRVEDASWPSGTIDRFVLSRLEREGLRPSPAAERRVLIRRLCLARPARPAEVDRPLSLAAAEGEAFRARPGAARRLVGAPGGEPRPEPEGLPGDEAADLAAWTVVANVLLNLDEFLTRG